jgi:hypothetical protein
MTISGSIPANNLSSQVELLPASTAQVYIVNLEQKLLALDGGPVYLVHDKETSTSDILVSELQDALIEERNIASQPLYLVLCFCFNNKLNFRVWLANNDMNAFINNTIEVKDLQSALESIRNQQGVWWHA